MLWCTIRDDLVVDYPHVTIRGPLQYDPHQPGLVHISSVTGEEQHLAVDLTSAGYVADRGEVFVPDYSEHAGTATALVESGVIEILETIMFGPFNTRAFRARVIQ